jgi:prepilin-type N-terminal cleavage/methylation domain-containing protein
MRAVFSKQNKGMSLVETLVASALMSIVILAAIQLLVEGGRYLRINQQATDAQRAGLAILSQVGSGMQATRPDLISTDAFGLVFATPFKEDGTVVFDSLSGELTWQGWVCFYYEDSTVTRRERPLAVPTDSPSSVPTPQSFAADRVRKVFSSEVSAFSVNQASTSPPIWSVDVTVGSMTDKQRYGTQLHSEVGPRN